MSDCENFGKQEPYTRTAEEHHLAEPIRSTRDRQAGLMKRFLRIAPVGIAASVATMEITGRTMGVGGIVKAIENANLFLADEDTSNLTPQQITQRERERNEKEWALNPEKNLTCCIPNSGPEEVCAFLAKQYYTKNMSKTSYGNDALWIDIHNALLSRQSEVGVLWEKYVRTIDAYRNEPENWGPPKSDGSEGPKSFYEVSIIEKKRVLNDLLAQTSIPEMVTGIIQNFDSNADLESAITSVPPPPGQDPLQYLKP